MSLINVSKLTFAYPSSYENVFENVSFQIDTDWKLGFVGRNGRGKTTFLNLLLGNYEYKGEISSSTDFEYFPYDVLNEDLETENIIYQILNGVGIWEVKKELSKLNVSEDVLYRKFSYLSKGEQTKVLLATLFLKKNTYLLLDEPTNHLDADGKEAVRKYLNSKKGFILVSHDRQFLDNSIDHIISINKTNIEVQKGNFSSWYQNKMQEDNSEMEKNKKLKNEIKRLKDSKLEKSKWSDKTEKSKFGGDTYDRGFVGHKAAKMMKKSKALEKRQEKSIIEKEGLLKNIEKNEYFKISFLKHHKNTLIEFKDVSIFYGEKMILNNLNFSLNSGERIAIEGENGKGKSSILKIVLGEDILYGGEILKAANLKVSYVSQDTSFLNGSLEDYIRNFDIDESLFKTVLRKLDFSRADFEKMLDTLSLGQKKKVMIAKSICEKAHIYIWDEPLNYIDVFSRIQIEELLKDSDITMLFVDHDKFFVDNVSNKRIIL